MPCGIGGDGWPGDGGGTVAVAKRKHRRNLSVSAFSGTVGVAADEINKRNHNQETGGT